MKHMKQVMKTVTVGLGIAGAITAAPLLAKANVFTDVSEDSWSYEHVIKMHELEVITGYPDGSFRGGASIRREHVAVMMDRGLDLPKDQEYTPFKDVSPTNDYLPAIQAVQQAGIFTGDRGNFKPLENMTRAQMAKVIVEAFELPMVKGYEFEDVKESNWAKDYISTLAYYGISTGSEGKFMADQEVRREQFAAFMDRAMQVREELDREEDVEEPGPIEPPAEEESPVDENEPTNPPKEDESDGNRFTYDNPSDDLIRMLEVYQNNPDVFLESDNFGEDKPFEEIGFETHPIAKKIYSEEAVSYAKEVGLKYKPVVSVAYNEFKDRYASRAKFQSEGYKNPTERLGESEVSFSGTGETDISLTYDFRSDRAHEFAKNIVALIYPSFASLDVLLDDMEQKVMNARENEKAGDSSGGNLEYTTKGDYEVHIGVDHRYEYMTLRLILQK